MIQQFNLAYASLSPLQLKFLPDPVCACKFLPSPDRLCAFNLFGLQCSTPYWLENQPWIRSDYKIQFMKQIWLVQSLLERIQRDIHTADPWNFIWFRADNSISIDPEHARCLLEREAYSDLGLCWLWPRILQIPLGNLSIDTSTFVDTLILS